MFIFTYLGFLYGNLRKRSNVLIKSHFSFKGKLEPFISAHSLDKATRLNVIVNNIPLLGVIVCLRDNVTKFLLFYDNMTASIISLALSTNSSSVRTQKTVY